MCYNFESVGDLRNNVATHLRRIFEKDFRYYFQIC
jgi:hypothetical protein